MSGSGIFGGKARPVATAEHRPGTRPEVSTLEHTARLWTPSQRIRQVALKSRSRTSFALLGRSHLTSHHSGGDDIGPDRQRSPPDRQARSRGLSVSHDEPPDFLSRAMPACYRYEKFRSTPADRNPLQIKAILKRCVQALQVECEKPLRCNGLRNSQSQICLEEWVLSGANRSARICCAGRNRRKR